MAARHRGRADDFSLSDKPAAEYFDHFEPPTPGEGSLTVVRH